MTLRALALSLMTTFSLGVAFGRPLDAAPSTAGGDAFSTPVCRMRVPFTVRFEESAAPPTLYIDDAESEPGKRIAIRFVPQEAERQISVICLFRDGGEWKEMERHIYPFWPRDKTALEVLGDAAPVSWKGQSLSGSVMQEGEEFSIRFLGRGIYRGQLKAGEIVHLHPKADARGQIAVGVPANLADEGFEFVDLTHLGKRQSPLEAYTVSRLNGVPFLVPRSGREALALKEAGWSEEKIDPSSFFENYDLGPAYSGDPRLPEVQVPRCDYLGAWVLARVDDYPAQGDRLTLRIGTRGKGAPLQRQFMLADYSARIPRGPGIEQDGFHLIYLPFTEAIAQDIDSEWIDVELTKEIRLARRSPDPCRYRWRPLGLPSGIEIAAITLEQSPLQLQIEPLSSGALFVAPETPRYRVRIRNVSGSEQSFTLAWRGIGREALETVEGNIKAGKEWEDVVTFAGLEPGHYHAEFLLRSGRRPLLRRAVMFARLPADEMKHREEGVLGTWDFGGNHFTSADPDFVGSVMKKLGLRYGMFRAPAATRASYGVIKGDEAKIDMHSGDPSTAAAMYAAKKREHPDLLPTLLLFHEDAISPQHSNRPPDLFSGKAPYRLTAQEEERFQKMMQTATEAAKSMRKEFPGVRLALGNGSITLREQMYRAGFPGDLFDSAGNESMCGANPPESQPPNSISVNSGLWMDRQLLDTYGYSDKPVSTCYEVIYPSSTPGNLSYETQADYLVRHVLHAMMWQPGIIRPGGISDMGNSYYHSNWGGSGLLTARPRFEPKPAAVALATLSRMLDGAAYERFLETGSDSAFLLKFNRKEGASVYPCWIVTGRRKARFEVKGAGPISATDWQGRQKTISVEAGRAVVMLSSTPQWLRLPPGSEIVSVALERPEPVAPEGSITMLDPQLALGEWQVEEKRDPLLESYNPLTPRRKGALSVEATASEILRLTLAPENDAPATVPMYGSLRHRKGIPIPEMAVELALQVDGNSGWGRIIFELKDAAGEIWTSIGARAQGGSDWLADAVGRDSSDSYRPGEIADWNTDDVYGTSRINFDDWGWIRVALPGRYPGGYPWPANSQWRSSGDGRVHLPFTLHRIIIEQSEKVLYLTQYRAPRRPDIGIRQLISIERPFDGMKDSPLNYVPRYQMNIR